MEELLSKIQPYATIITSILSLAALTFIINLMKQVSELFNQRVEAIKDRASILEERLKLREDEIKRLEDVNFKVTKIGANLGIEEFKKELSSGVIIGGNIGEGFAGQIAGRDIIGTINEIGKRVEENSQYLHKHLSQNIDKLIDQSQKIAGPKELPIVKQEYFHRKIPVPDERFYTDDRAVVEARPSFVDGEATRKWLNRRFELLMSIPGAREDIQRSVRNIESAVWKVDEVRFDIAPRQVDVSFICTQRISFEDLQDGQ